MYKCGILIIFLLCCDLLANASEPEFLPWENTKTKSHKNITEILIKFTKNVIPNQYTSGKAYDKCLNIARSNIPKEETAESFIEKCSKLPDVIWVQKNEWRYALATKVTPNDPYYYPDRNQRQYQQWYLPKINANFAWSISKGQKDLIIAVLDSGVDLQHPDIKHRLLRGITLVNQDDYHPPADGQDDNGHGTIVAGIIGAITDNGLGVSGCSWLGKILPVKVLNQKGEGTDMDIAQGIIWSVNAGARIINLSLGGPSDNNLPPLVLQDAVDYAYTHGCLVIAAAGNSGDDTKFYPAALENVLTLGATDPWDKRAAYSNYGWHIDLVAPGGAAEAQFNKETGILSTYWNENSRITDYMDGSEAGEYAITAGTSMAAALATGAAIVVWGYNPTYSMDQVESRLISTALDIGEPGNDQETGAGRINLLAAVDNSAVAEQPELTVYNYPNPFHPERDKQTYIVFMLNKPQPVEIRIYDIARDLVWQTNLLATQTKNGKNIVAWNGRNSKKQAVANGAYYYRISLAQGKSSHSKIIAVLR